MLADNEIHPALPAAALPVVRDQTAQLAAGTLASPGYRMSRALQAALVPKDDPTLREATPKSISALTLGDVREYYATSIPSRHDDYRHYRRHHAREARPVLEKWFGGWKAAGPKPAVQLPAVPANQPAAINVPDSAQIQDSVNLSQQVKSIAFTRIIRVKLGDRVLGGGFYATRLYRDLRQKAGYVYNVNNALRAGQKRAPTYSVTYGCDPENVSKARMLIEQELASMRSTNVTDAELQQAKALLLRQTTLSESSEETVARGLVARALVGLPLDEPTRAAQRYYALTADQVRTAFEKWIRPGDLVQVVRGPAPK